AQTSNINTDTALPVLEFPTFNSMRDLYPLHKGYATLPHEFQLGIGKRTAHVTKKFELPLTRLLDGDHLVEWKEKREACIYCCYLLLRGKKAINYDNPPQ
ncbi:20683_t:CDS:2, partial [Gigaspora rosea]